MKDKERLENSSRVKATKETWQSSETHGPECLKFEWSMGQMVK